MTDIDQLVRKNILDLQPYSSARDEFMGMEGVFLDANESPEGMYNRYPDPYQQKLKQRISALKDVPEKNIFLGNGSDEVIDLLFRVFCNPGKDKCLIFPPTYGMYAVSASVNDVACLEAPLRDDFQPDPDKVDLLLRDPSIKLIFLCSPNNPTGNTIEAACIERILRQSNGIVVLDEAYIDFGSQPSWSARMVEYPNLVVLQTLSKARALAGARLGMAFADERIIRYLNKVKPPYNISTPNQEAAHRALEDEGSYRDRLALIRSGKKFLKESLNALEVVQRVYPSDANFLLVKVSNADEVYEALLGEKVIVRNRSRLVEGCLRITVGTPLENELLIRKMKNLK